MSWATFFAGAIGPVVRKVIFALGMGVLSFTGLDLVKTRVDEAVAAAWTGVTGDVYAVISMSGFVDAVSYWLAAITTVVAWVAISRIGAMPGGPA